MKQYYVSSRHVFSFLLLFAGGLFTNGLNAQLSINSSVTAATLVTNLVGAGLTVSNINLNCPTGAYGTFTNGSSTNLGINNGIVLTSGAAANAIGPNNSASAGTCNNTSFSDAQLVALEPQATYDPCILEFDIIPECNTLTISFVFGSEEYPEFVNAGFNDVFGFFISGPGPACQANYYNNTDIATLPNNTTLVSIDNVNAGNNSAYYVDNTGGATIQYDGFTTVLTRNVTLCPCQTYHFKLAIADAGDCIYDSGVFVDFMACSTALTSSISSTPATGCTGCNGSATVTASGGTGPYTYSWSPGGYTTSTVNNLCPGTYTVTYNDAITCSPSQTVAVTVGSTGGGMTVTQSQVDILCNGGCNGTADVNVTSGSSPFTYVWSPNPGGGQGTPNATGLCPGVYTCAITDATGCTNTQTITITEPPALSVSTSSTPAACGGNNGSVTATGAGGAGGYSYAWSPGGYTTSTVNSLTSGTYNVIVTDANGCTTGASVVIGTTGALSSTQSLVNVDCFGAATGSASVNVTGNIGSINYAWNPNVSSAASANNLAAGTYVVTATDSVGCTSSQTITITEPPQLTLQAGGFNVTCFGACDGQVVVLPAGGSPTYSFLWNTGCTSPNCNAVCAGNYNVTVTDANGCTATSSTIVTEPPAITIATSVVDAHCNQADGSASAVGGGGSGGLTYAWLPSGSGPAISNITAGSYSVIVTDQNGCDDTAQVIVNNINGIVASLNTVVDASCFGLSDGSASVNASGGTGPITYAWSPAPANSSTTNSATNLPAGNYQVVITDSVGCSFTILASVTEPPQLTVVASANPSSLCEGQSAQLTGTPAGGTPAYTVTWNPGGPGSPISITPQTTTTYTVDVTDANGCAASSTVTVTVNALPVAALIADTTSGCSPLCVDFSDLSSVASGTITQWAWDFGDGNFSTLQNPVHCYTTPGNYSVTLLVTTGNGCTQTVTMSNYIDVFINPVAGFTSSPQPTTILTAEIFFTDTSSNAVSWSWNFGDLNASSSSSQNPSFIYPDPICYLVTQAVTSADGCVDTATAEICIDPDVAIYVPNAFSPNDDAMNEFFNPVCIGIDPEKFQMWIFDRWGNLIFYTEDLNEGWNGKVQGGSDICQIDTYVWKVKAIDVLGKKHTLIGHVNLIR
jgi:gliding motility-associated-like protein